MIGSTALWLLYLWLGSAIAGSYLSHRKGYGERVGLASGLLLTFVGPLIWLIVPPRADSLWKKDGPFGRPKARDAPPERAEDAGGGDATAGPGATA